ncbi:DUF4266 domain-containing protein [Taibaiella chishuiensis]|uniref:Uncharacterized protein DUF4266 n=1 Tax=Taibaiella chishuiensis TaxID=1434707 RepID=A0A2P8D4P8_9BACT|nr:DUF4266 domain-containing protein [Taibaiella chishuiensis]PSK92196.1 uncharacterized protein DUF4266 [Taibaiella chishuiensis]
MLPSEKGKCTTAILLLLAVLILGSCTAVKPYQRAYLNDAAMQPGKLPIEKFEENAQAYREGASGGGTGKSSGGCGCN